ncbi:LOW QUALITY PROTEIN: DNA polymerase theta-like [Pecten maximus]|uniref:LOW QUALITY PROTEIN: DNA polymerase theta-like n=1 Tax=Pecten maximus TaxID=6579 RepID=UPI001458FA8A|nr:LOW QUALITY PROTEIN: DNA polymerase theta-like [Pecten maximus]
MATREDGLAVGRKRLGRLPVNTHSTGREPNSTVAASRSSYGTTKQVGKHQFKQEGAAPASKSSFSLSLCSEFDTEMVDIMEQMEKEEKDSSEPGLKITHKGKTTPGRTSSKLQKLKNGKEGLAFRQSHTGKWKTTSEQEKLSPKPNTSNKRDAWPGKCLKRLSVGEDPNLSWDSPQEASTPNLIHPQGVSKRPRVSDGTTPQVQTQLFKSLFTIPSPMCGLETSQRLEVDSQKENSSGRIRNEKSRFCETPQKSLRSQRIESLCTGKETSREKKGFSRKKRNDTEEKICDSDNLRKLSDNVQSLPVTKNSCQRSSGKKRKSLDRLVLVEDSQSPEAKESHAVDKPKADSKEAGINSNKRTSNTIPVSSAVNCNKITNNVGPVLSAVNGNEKTNNVRLMSSAVNGYEKTSNVEPVSSAVNGNKKTSSVGPVLSAVNGNKKTSSVGPVLSAVNGNKKTSSVGPVLSAVNGNKKTSSVGPVLSAVNGNKKTSSVGPVLSAVNGNEKTNDFRLVSPAVNDNEKTSNVGPVSSAVNGNEKTNDFRLASPAVNGNEKTSNATEMRCIDSKTQKELDREISDGHTDRLVLANWGLPDTVLKQYHRRGIITMFDWQAECLCTENVLAGGNLVYSAPTSAGKTMVAELLVLKRIVETKKKAIIILPFVSVTREKMFYLQELYQDAGIRVNGFMGSHSPPGGLSSVDVAVCTIEKGNGLINRMLEDNTLGQLGIIVVDELHLVGDPHRGYLLELLLTKICYVIRKENAQVRNNQKSVDEITHNPIQIVGMSATLPNLELLAGWLNAKMFLTDFRPVPLTETIKLGTAIYDSCMSKIRDIDLTLTFKGDDDHVIPLCLETLNNGHSVLIFCPSKNWCEKLCESIAREFYNILRNDMAARNSTEFHALPLNRAALSDVVEQLRRTPVGLDSTLGRTVYYGVAYHHAGLTFDERDIVEGGFRQGILKVLVATSTLSSGVNLPARRVIIRSPVVHAGKTIDFLTYKQMIGRAGRKGVDTEGESILICKGTERSKAMTLVRSALPPVQSCLLKNQGQLSSSLKRAILEIVVSGVATCPNDVVTYISCTMLAASLPSDDQQAATIIQDCITFLQENEFVTLQKSAETEEERFRPSQLGSAVLASSMSPDEGLSVFAELRKARQCFVLENELHIIYLVTPIYTMDLGDKIDWYQFYCMWEKLTPDMKRVAELVGVQEGFLARAVQGRLPTKTVAQARAVAVHRRFYTALILHDLVHEVPLNEVAHHYNCNKGQLQSLQQSAATFAGMVTVFCARLGWHNLELILSQFQNRLTFGVQRELCDLVRLTLLNGQRARVLFNAGFHTVAALASALPADVEAVLKSSSPFQSNKKQENETEWEAEQRRKSRCIWLTGRKGVTEQEAALAIIEEAKSVIQDELGGLGIQWRDNQDIEPSDRELGSAENEVRLGERGPGSNNNGPEQDERGAESVTMDESSIISGQVHTDSRSTQSSINISSHKNSSFVIGPGRGSRSARSRNKSRRSSNRTNVSLNVTGTRSQIQHHSVVVSPQPGSRDVQAIVSPPGKAVIMSKSKPISIQGHLKDSAIEKVSEPRNSICSLTNTLVINVSNKANQVKSVGGFTQKERSGRLNSTDVKLVVDNSDKDIHLNKPASASVTKSMQDDSSQENVEAMEDSVKPTVGRSANIQHSSEEMSEHKVLLKEQLSSKVSPSTIVVEADVHIGECGKTFCDVGPEKPDSGGVTSQEVCPRKRSPSPIKFDQIIEDISFTFDDSFGLSGLAEKEGKGHEKEDETKLNDLNFVSKVGPEESDCDKGVHGMEVLSTVGKLIGSSKDRTAKKTVAFNLGSSESHINTVTDSESHDDKSDIQNTDNEFADSFELDSQTDFIMGDIPEKPRSEKISPVSRGVQKGSNLTSPSLYSEDLAGSELVDSVEHDQRKDGNLCTRNAAKAHSSNREKKGPMNEDGKADSNPRDRKKEDGSEHVPRIGCMQGRVFNHEQIPKIDNIHSTVTDSSVHDVSLELIAASNFDDRQYGYSEEGTFELTGNDIADGSYGDLRIVPQEVARVTSLIQEKKKEKPPTSQSTQDFVLALEMSDSFSCTAALAVEVEQNDQNYVSSEVKNIDSGGSGDRKCDPKSVGSGTSDLNPKAGGSEIKNCDLKSVDPESNFNVIKMCKQDIEIDSMDESLTISMVEKALEINSEENTEDMFDGSVHTVGKQTNRHCDVDNKKMCLYKSSKPISSLENSVCSSWCQFMCKHRQSYGVEKSGKNKVLSAQTRHHKKQQPMNSSHKHLSPGTLDFLNSMCESGSVSNTTNNRKSAKHTDTNNKKQTTLVQCDKKDTKQDQNCLKSIKETTRPTNNRKQTISSKLVGSAQKNERRPAGTQKKSTSGTSSNVSKYQSPDFDPNGSVRITRSQRKHASKEIDDDKSRKQETVVSGEKEDSIQNVSTGSDCLPPTPPATNYMSPHMSHRKPTPVKVRGITPGRGKASQKLDLCVRQSGSSKESDQNLTEPDVLYEERLPVIDPNDSGIPCTQASFTIVDVCADQRLFDTFIKEWSTKSFYTVSVACENRPPQPVVGGGIGGNFVAPGSRERGGVVDGMKVEGEMLVVVGVAISWENRDAYYVALTKENSDCDLDDSLTPPPMDNSISIETRLCALQSVLEQGTCGDELINIAMFDVKASYCVLVRSCGIAPRGRFQDPKVACWLMDPGAKEKNLHRMVTNYLPTEVPLLDGIGGGVGFSSLGMTPQNPGSGRYRATTEAVLTLHVMDYLRACLLKEGLHQAFQTVEMPSIVTLARMQLNGFGFSEIECESQQSIMTAKLTALEEQAYQMAGHPFSLTSPEDIAQVLFIELQLPPNGDPSSVGQVQCPRKTPAARRGRQKTRFSTSKEVLEKLKKLHPLPGLVLEWRRISSALTKVVFPLQKEKVHVSHLNMHRIFCECQVHTATGRVSMSEPNLQNIPKDFEISLPDIIGESPPANQAGLRQITTGRGRGGSSRLQHFTGGPRQAVSAGSSGSSWAVSMRHAFIPFTGGVMLAADYSQLELRMIAHLSGDSKLARILNQDGDVFKMIAAQWKNVSVDHVTPQQRQQAKQVCYGMVYGIGPKALGEQLEVDENEAAVFIETFKSRYPGMRTFLRKAVETCRDKGYVETILGRRRYLPSIKDTNPHARAHAERQAVNTTVQGSAADLVKKAMNRIDVRLSDVFPECSFAHRQKPKDRGAYGRSRENGPYRVLSGGYLVLQLHDELIYEIAHADVMEAAKIIKHEMEHAMTLSVRMPVKVKVGPSWGKLEDMEI